MKIWALLIAVTLGGCTLRAPVEAPVKAPVTLNVNVCVPDAGDSD